jgi:flotillin
MLAKKAEGLRQIVDACGGAQQAFQLLMLEHLDKLAETSAKAISNIKFDKVVVWENGQQNGQTSVANFLQGVSRTMPPMMQVLRDVAGIELPETLVRVQPDLTPPGPDNGAPAAGMATGHPAPPPAPPEQVAKRPK